MNWREPTKSEARLKVLAVAELPQITIEVRQGRTGITLEGILPGGASDAYYTGKRFETVEAAKTYIEDQFQCAE